MRRLTAVLAACAGLVMAAGFQVQGNMSEAWDSGSLKVRTGEEPAKIWFALPPHSGVTVVAKPDTGVAVTTRLNMSGAVNLPFQSEYAVKVTRDSGEGQWTCRDAIGSPVLLGFGSWIDEKHGARMTYVADEDEEIWRFESPKEATFLVQRPDASGKVIEQQDLYDSDQFELVGGGSFTLEIVSTEGSGEFSAEKK